MLPSPIGCLETTLDLHRGTVHDPEVTLAVEYQSGAIEGEYVWIAPDAARPITGVSFTTKRRMLAAPFLL